MKDKIFIDSNIFLYAFCDKDKTKHTIASSIILQEGIISVQVINEVSADMQNGLKIEDLTVKNPF